MRLGRLLSWILLIAVAHEVWIAWAEWPFADLVEMKVKSADGYVVPCWPRLPDEACANELRKHDEIATSIHNSLVGPPGQPWSAKGPEGLVFVFPPGTSQSEAANWLEAEYPPDMAKRIASGEFQQRVSPEFRTKLALLIAGWSAENINAAFDTPEAAGRKAIADAMAENERRREQTVAPVPPLSTEFSRISRGRGLRRTTGLLGPRVRQTSNAYALRFPKGSRRSRRQCLWLGP